MLTVLRKHTAISSNYFSACLFFMGMRKVKSGVGIKMFETQKRKKKKIVSGLSGISACPFAPSPASLVGRFLLSFLRTCDMLPRSRARRTFRSRNKELRGTFSLEYFFLLAWYLDFVK